MFAAAYWIKLTITTGTGKTTTARKIGKVFYDMGFLSGDAVLECSATDLIGQFVGHTGPKVVQKLDEALGSVLFIDEAYRLADGQFGKEATDELVDCLTKKQYKSKMIVVLAGYESEINRLLSVNPGLSSRFPEEIFFHSLDPEMCLKLLLQKLPKNEKFKLKLSEARRKDAMDVFKALAVLPGWGNGRDIETLVTRIISTVLSTCVPVQGVFQITWDMIMPQLAQLHSERKARASSQIQADDITSAMSTLNLATQSKSSQPPRMSRKTLFNTASSKGEPPVAEEQSQSRSINEIQRDPGVPDHIWLQLQADRKSQALAEQSLATAVSEFQEKQHRLTQEAERATKLAAEMEAQAQIDDEAKRRHEAMRLAAIEARRKADAEAERQKKMLEQQKQEAKAQQKLREMGVCPVGYRWIKQAGGYRCAGGSHFVGNGQLDL